MTRKAILVLADSSVYEGYSFGAGADAFGEVVFNTSMTGYQEMLTDPSYAGQIVVPTYPLIGNYGVNEQDFESKRIQVRGFVVKEECLEPNHYLSQKTINSYLADGGIPGIWGVDTRAITRKLRSVGVMMGIITSDKTSEEALAVARRKLDRPALIRIRAQEAHRAGVAFYRESKVYLAAAIPAPFLTLDPQPEPSPSPGV